jgi:hypothetical protein
MRPTAPKRGGAPGPSGCPGPGPIWRDEHGQATADHLGVLLIVSVVVAALFVSGAGATIADRAGVLICRIGGGQACTVADRAGKPLERCLVSRSQGTANLKLFVGVVEVGKDSILIREDFSDGTSRFTLIDSTELKGQLFAGARAKAGRFGLNAAAEAAAGGQLKGAQVFELPADKADEFQTSVAAAGGFDGLLRDAAAINDDIPLIGLPNPLGGLDDLALDVLGVDEDDPQVDPTEEYVDVSLIVDGIAGAGAGAGVFDAEVSATARGAAGAKVIHKGARAGELELYYSLKGELGGSLSAGLYGASLGGESSFVATLVLDGHGRPKTLRLVGAAGYTGALALGDSLEGKDAQQVHKTLETLSLSATAGDGQALQVGAELDLTDPLNRAAALRLLTPGAGGQAAAVPELLRRIERDAKLTVDFFTVAKDTADGEIKVGLGIGGGVGGGSVSEDKTATGSYVREPGGTFQERRCKR